MWILPSEGILLYIYLSSGPSWISWKQFWYFRFCSEICWRGTSVHSELINVYVTVSAQWVMMVSSWKEGIQTLLFIEWLLDIFTKFFLLFSSDWFLFLLYNGRVFLLHCIHCDFRLWKCVVHVFYATNFVHIKIFTHFILCYFKAWQKQFCQVVKWLSHQLNDLGPGFKVLLRLILKSCTSGWTLLLTYDAMVENIDFTPHKLLSVPWHSVICGDYPFYQALCLAQFCSVRYN